MHPAAPANQNIAVSFHHDLEIREAVLPSVRSNRVVAFVHGAGLDAKLFDEWMTSLALNDGIRSFALSLEGHGQSAERRPINSVGIEHYKQNIVDFLEHLGARADQVYPVLHSMGGRCGYELVFEGKMPEAVQEVTLLNPVPDTGTIGSAIEACFRDFIVSGRPTFATFPWALLTKNLGHFFKSNPDRFISLFFSSDSKDESRLANVTPEEFCNRYVCDESARAMRELLLPSPVKPRNGSVPLHIVGTNGDRIVSRTSLEALHERIRNTGHPVSTPRFYDEISHGTPMDIDGERVLDDLRVAWR